MKDYNGVIVEYKGKNFIRIIEGAEERRARQVMLAQITPIIAETKRMSNMGGIQSSVAREGTHRPWYSADSYSDLKCWKNQRHARKSWMRHIHRIGRSVHLLVDQCIYPNINSFERG